MITIDALVIQLRGLRREDLTRWIDSAWVRPTAGAPGQYLFGEIDVARVRLILELRDEMQVNEDALPVVLSLLDQLYALRRQTRQLAEALGQAAPDEVRADLLRRLAS